jgi:peptide/nickel transport system ATP-binding protein
VIETIETGSRNEAALLSVEGLSVKFRAGRNDFFAAVKNVSFAVPSNSAVALVGESGSGKTVTALAIMGLLPKQTALIPAESRAAYCGRDLLKLSGRELCAVRGKEIAMIFQEPMSSLNPVYCVGEQIAESLRLHLGMSKRQARARAAELLAEVGVADPRRRMRAYPHELSGGQQQRVMIALAIACEPKLLVADEPTTALDVTIQKQILDLILGLRQRRRMSVLFITHDLDLVAQLADTVVVMRAGEIQESGSARQIFEGARHPYTRALLACRPQVGARAPRLPVIEDFLREQSDATPLTLREHEHTYPEESKQIVLEARDVSKDFMVRARGFARQPFHAVKRVSFKLEKGSTLGLVGESGCGKSTLAMTLARLIGTTSGQAWFKGQDILAITPRQFLPYKRHLQIVFQNPYASLNPRFTVEQILIEPMLIHRIGTTSGERNQLAMEILAKVGLPRRAFHCYPHEFSGGQRQRIAIARCLTLTPEVLICDEPVSALDVSVQAQVLNLLKDLQAEFAMSYLFISHDLAVVKHMSDDIMVMREGEIVECAAADEIYARPRHAYTRQLLEAIPRGWQARSAG